MAFHMFGCQLDWPDMVRYARSLNVHVVIKEDKAAVKKDDKCYDDSNKLQKVLYQYVT